MPTAHEFQGRLAVARERLLALRPRIESGAPWPLSQRFDHTEEASWGPPEVLAHVAEMLPYWLGEVERIRDGPSAPVPFGRIGSDPVRVAIIGRDRTLPVRELYARVGHGLDRWSERLSRASPDDWAKRGLHPTRGEMSVAEIVERMIVAHTEEHVEQLESSLG